MSVERRSEIIPASGRLEAARGNYFLLLSSTVAVNLRLDGRGTSEGFNNITGGVRIRRIVPWDTAQIFGAAGGTVIYIVGHENVREDDVDVFLQVATVAGTVAVADQPSSTITTPAAAVRATGGADTIAANPLRRRITICALSTNTDSLFLQAIGAGAGRGIELQPGLFVEIETTAAIDVRNDSGANQTYMVFEES